MLNAAAYHRLEQQFLAAIGPRWHLDLAAAVAAASSGSSVPPLPAIAISGDQLTGKSTLSRNLVRRFRGHGITAGQVFRARAAELGISVAELSRRALADPSIDIAIEYGLARDLAAGRSASPAETGVGVDQGESPACLVAEGRMCGVVGHYLRTQHSRAGIFTVFLRAPPRTLALRWINREVSPERALEAAEAVPEDKGYQSLADLLPFVHTWDPKVGAAFQDNIDRDAADHRRYREFYGADPALDYRNLGLYDVVVDTTGLGVEEVESRCLEGLRSLPAWSCS